MDPSEFGAYLSEKADWVDAELATYLDDLPAVPPLPEGVRYALGLDRAERQARGKRLRPVLCLLTCESLGGDLQRALPFAAASEMLHNFFLVHDDIEDRDGMRRGRESVWVRYGEEHGINIGDYMLASTYDLILGSGSRGVPPERVLALVDLVTRTLRRTGEGQALDMGSRSRHDVTVEDYLRMVTLKTGYYLAAPLVGGALLAEAPEETVETLFSLGNQVGPIFQIADDVLDLTVEKGRGESGSDVKEGKRSYLVVLTAAASSPEERNRLFAILDTPRADTPDDEVAWVLDLFAKHDAVAQAKAQGRALLDEAHHLLATLPSPLDANLGAAVEFMLERTI